MSLARPEYGIDAPGVIRNLLLIGLVLLLMALFLPKFTIGSVTFAMRRMEIWVGVICLLEGLAMTLYAKVGKFRHRDRMLGYVNWRGNESVLDVGTGPRAKTAQEHASSKTTLFISICVSLHTKREGLEPPTEGL